MEFLAIFKTSKVKANINAAYYSLPLFFAMSKARNQVLKVNPQRVACFKFNLI